MMQGNKNISCIYAKSTFEGTGKTTLQKFIFTLGYPSTCKGKSDHLKGQHLLKNHAQITLLYILNRLTL